MTRAADETRTATLNLRTKPSIKAIADKLAREDDRSVTQFIERLILAEETRRKEAKKGPKG